MTSALWQSGKRTAGWLLAQANSDYSYDKCVFILAHMRCGSTALSNILCSRTEISGYGEAHVRYEGRSSLGQLALNHMRRGGWKRRADFMFDKILHNRHDCAAPPEFTQARAIFMARRPDAAIRSITSLYNRLERDEYRTHDQAAVYYVKRMQALSGMWNRFPRDRRIGLTHTSLVQDPDAALSLISAHLGFEPPLENRYKSPKASRKGGGGDPLTSGKHDSIQKNMLRSSEPVEPLAISKAMARAAGDAYAGLRNLVAQEWPDLASE